VHEDCDPRRRNKDVRISPAQFIHDREIGIRGEKQGVIINDDNNDEKEYWFDWLGDETVHIDFEERFFLAQSLRFNKGIVLSVNEK